MFFNYGFAAIESFAEPIVRALDDRVSVIDTFYLLFTTWQNTVGRLLIGLRRLGTGGAFLLTPRPYARGIHIGQPFPYSRLKDATILSVLDKAYVRALDEEEGYSIATAGSVQAALAREIHCANTDLDDRRTAVTGAVKLATSLAAVDGLVLMTPSLAVVGFGAKITASRTPQVIYDGADYAKRGTRARTVDPVRYGTRHGSMFRYCAMDPRARGLVMSQDGYARMIMSSGQHLVMWDGMKLLDHENYSSQIVERERRSRKRRAAAPWPYKLGYTRTPKTLQALVMVRRRRRSRSPRVR